MFFEIEILRFVNSWRHVEEFGGTLVAVTGFSATIERPKRHEISRFALCSENFERLSWEKSGVALRLFFHMGRAVDSDTKGRMNRNAIERSERKRTPLPLRVRIPLAHVQSWLAKRARDRFAANEASD